MASIMQQTDYQIDITLAVEPSKMTRILKLDLFKFQTPFSSKKENWQEIRLKRLVKFSNRRRKNHRQTWIALLTSSLRDLDHLECLLGPDWRYFLKFFMLYELSFSIFYLMISINCRHHHTHSISHQGMAKVVQEGMVEMQDSVDVVQDLTKRALRIDRFIFFVTWTFNCENKFKYTCLQCSRTFTRIQYWRWCTVISV